MLSGQQMLNGPLLAGASRLVQLFEPLDGIGVSLFGRYQQ
jgi:hypothetical protein